MESQWELPLALMGGTPAMRRGREKWLPRSESEHPSVYEARLQRSYLFGVYKRVITALIGSAFSTNVSVSGVPKELEYLEFNADGRGQSLTEHASQLFSDLLIYGKAHDYCDFPNVEIPRGLSQAEYNSLGLRPYFARISPINLIGWSSDYNNGFPSLEHIRIADSEVRINEEYEEEERELIRLVSRDSIQLWGKDFSGVTRKGSGDFILLSESENVLGYVPLQTSYANSQGLLVAEPPLIDLAYLNLEHYQSSSDQANILHLARVPFLLGTGFSNEEADELTIAANNMVISDNKEASIRWVEHSGASINSGRQALKDLEDRLKASGAEIVFAQSVARQTAQARQLDQQDALSTAQVALRSLEQQLEQNYLVAADWMNVSKDGIDPIISIGADLDLAHDPNPVQGLVSLAEFFGLDPETALEEAKRRGLLAKHLSVKDIQLMEDRVQEVQETQEVPLENEPENQPTDLERS